MTRNSFFHKKLDFLQTQFFTRNSIFDQKLSILTKNSVFRFLNLFFFTRRILISSFSYSPRNDRKADESPPRRRNDRSRSRSY